MSQLQGDFISPEVHVSEGIEAHVRGGGGGGGGGGVCVGGGSVGQKSRLVSLVLQSHYESATSVVTYQLPPKPCIAATD